MTLDLDHTFRDSILDLTKADWVFENTGKKLMRNLKGDVGVEEVQLPQGAAHEIERGIHESSGLTEITEF